MHTQGMALIDYSLVCTFEGMRQLLLSLRPFTIIKKAENEELYNAVSSRLIEIDKEYQNENKFFEAKIHSLITDIFVQIGRLSDFENTDFPGISQSKQHEYITKFVLVCDYIHDHYSEDINADTLADIAGFSKYHFSRLFKQYTGSTYYDYLTKTRIEMAEKYLIEPEISITEVAMRSGFNSLSTFNRVFKSLKGCTPSEYKGLNRYA